MNKQTTATPSEADCLELEVFRAGDYGPKGTWDEDALARIAESYDTALHEAPITLDHRQDGPAEGWIKGLRRAGNRLVASLHRISPRLRELLGSGAYRKRSVELYRRLPATDGPYLKALSFLGAAAPEVKGLADPLFREGNDKDGVLRFDEETPTPSPSSQLRESMIAEGRWNPAWDAAGLPEVFDALSDERLRTILAEALALGPPAVSFGSEGRSNATHADSPIVHFNGTPSPASVALHERALRNARETPGLDYREALLAASRATH